MKLFHVSLWSRNEAGGSGGGGAVAGRPPSYTSGDAPLFVQLPLVDYSSFISYCCHRVKHFLFPPDPELQDRSSHYDSSLVSLSLPSGQSARLGDTLTRFFFSPALLRASSRCPPCLDKSPTGTLVSSASIMTSLTFSTQRVLICPPG